MEKTPEEQNIENLQKQQVEDCAKEIECILKKYRCGYDVNLTVNTVLGQTVYVPVLQLNLLPE